MFPPLRKHAFVIAGLNGKAGFDVFVTAVFIEDSRQLLMNFDTKTTVGRDIIEITVSGQHAIQKVYTTLEHLRVTVDRTGLNKAIVDGREVTGTISEADRFLTGQRVAEIFGPRIRLVILMKAENITKLGELAARNRGALLLVTDCETEALSFLAEG